MGTMVHTGTDPYLHTQLPPGTDRALVSVVVLNYNYGRYLKQCIESILAQDYGPVEVIVVDDGSTDNSAVILDAYAGRVLASWKPNGGMVSAMNRGFQLSHGAVVIFVDADDYLLPGAVSAHALALLEPRVVRSQTYMIVLDGTESSQRRIPGATAPQGDVSDLILERGPGAYISSPNSGNAWSRNFLERVFPLPEQLRTIGAETFLMDAAPLFGRIVTLNQPRAAYRLHQASMQSQSSEMNLENMRKVVSHHQLRAAWLAETAASLGHTPSVTEWMTSNWRLATLAYLCGQPPVSPVPTLAQHLRSAFKVRGNLMKRLIVAAVITAIRLAPAKLARQLASQVISLRYM